MVDKAEDTVAAPPWIFHREIVFVMAKKQYTGFSNGGGGFRLETLNPTKSDPNKQGKRPDPEEPKELELDPKLSFGFSIMKIGAGLENLGNTCYLNSVLQCLTYTEPLAASLQSGRHKSSCRKAGFCALCAIQNHISRALQSTGKYLVPNDLVSNLRCISRNFQRQRMEDAHEYMVNLLESMHKCCLPSGVPSESPSAFEKSLVHQIFGGRLRSQVKCMQCSFSSDKFDPFLDLSLEINKADSLQKALTNFTTEEYLDGGAKEYQCQRCKQKVKALKKLSIYKAPNVLSIHLKRFRRHQPGQTQKIDKKVHFGPTLDLKPFVSGPYDGDLKYTLYGVLVHSGWNIHSGHCYCFIRTSSGIWHSLDDTTVSTVRENMVFDEKAYMLFYVRDRRNVIPKKPVDVGHAKSMIINVMGNRMQLNATKVPSTPFQNGLTSKRVDSLQPSPALTQVDVAVTGALKAALTKGKSIQETTPENLLSSSLEKEVQLNTSSVMTKVKADKNMNDKLAIKPSCNGIHSSSVDSHVKDSIPMDYDSKGSKIVNSSSQVEEPSHVNIQIGGPSKKRINGDRSKKMELSGFAPTGITTSQRAPACKRQRKLKKKFSKCQITATRLSSGIILGVALSVRKKIKKKVKRSALKISIPTEQSVPSTSEPTMPLLPITLHSPGKRSKLSSSKSENISNLNHGNGYNGNLAEGVINEKSRVRVGQNGDAVATDPQLCISTSHLPRHDSVGGEGNILQENRIDSKQNGIMNMLTRELEETIVARWDEIERPLSQIAGRSGNKPVTIGYIGDDWDEEYDKGKRKKVRTSITEFGGPNPFQEIATKKAKSKSLNLKRL